MRRPHLPREGELLLPNVHRHDGESSRGPRPQDGTETYPAQPEHGHRASRLHPGGVEHRTDPREDRTAEQGRHFRRHVRFDPHEALLCGHRVPREGGHPQVVVQGLLTPVEVARPVQQTALHVGRVPPLAQGGTPYRAEPAPPAGGHEAEHHPVAFPDFGHPRAHGPHHARGLVAQDHGHDPGPGPVDHGQVGVAQPRGLDLHQDLAGPWILQLHLLQPQRLRLPVRPGTPHLVQHRCPCPHRIPHSLKKGFNVTHFPFRASTMARARIPEWSLRE
ncbi:hypothetical protein HRbin31_00888 [bacterium HR31]|nr:hypothetical protein HRbin31_00888 [bacterium HR31]